MTTSNSIKVNPVVTGLVLGWNGRWIVLIGLVGQAILNSVMLAIRTDFKRALKSSDTLAAVTSQCDERLALTPALSPGERE
jgi:hypothetical protein